MMRSFIRGAGLVLALATILLLPAGCDDSGSKKSQAAKKFDSMGEGSAERVGGGSNEDDEGAIPFRIVRVYRDQKPLKQPPFHENGGAWTYLDCCIGEGASAINFGLAEQHADGMWGRAMLDVPDKETGAKLVESIGHALGAKPRPAFAGSPPLFIDVATAMLASDDSKQDPAADAAPPPAGPPSRFDGKPGSGWSAIKLFFPATDAELFLNFNIALRSGAFSPKDEDYADDVAFELGAALRDGPVGRRPTGDPALALKPVRFGPWRKVGGKDLGSIEFSPDGRRINYRIFQKTPPTTKIMEMDPQQPAQPRTIIDFDGYITHYERLGDGTQCVVDETVSQDNRSYSTDDPHRVWIVNTKTHEKQKLDFWDGVRADWDENPLSPDQRFYILSVKERKNKTQETRVEVYDFKTQQHRVLLNGSFITSLAWTGQGDGLRLTAVVIGPGAPKNRTRDAWSVNPADGKATQIPTPPEQDFRAEIESLDKHESFTPDAALHVERGPQGEFFVVDAKTETKRELKLSEGERSLGEHLNVRWLSPRFIALDAGEFTLLDSQTMQLSYPMEDKKITPQIYSSDFKWVIGRDAERAAHLAPILVDAP